MLSNANPAQWDDSTHRHLKWHNDPAQYAGYRNGSNEVDASPAEVHWLEADAFNRSVEDQMIPAWMAAQDISPTHTEMLREAWIEDGQSWIEAYLEAA